MYAVTPTARPATRSFLLNPMLFLECETLVRRRLCLIHCGEEEANADYIRFLAWRLGDLCYLSVSARSALYDVTEAAGEEMNEKVEA